MSQLENIVERLHKTAQPYIDQAEALGNTLDDMTKRFAIYKNFIDEQTEPIKSILKEATDKSDEMSERLQWFVADLFKIVASAVIASQIGKIKTK